MITKRKDGYYVVSHTTGRNLGGPYDSREKAEARLAQVRAFKYMSKKGSYVMNKQGNFIGRALSVASKASKSKALGQTIHQPLLKPSAFKFCV